MNRIDELRTEIARYFNPALKLDDYGEILISPNGKYRVTVDVYRLDDPTRNWMVSDVRVVELSSDTEIVRFKRSDDQAWYCWVERDDVEYLVCSEALDGQTVIDLTNRRMESWCSSLDEGDFIWTSISASPTGGRLAIIGCYWACPYELVVVDFSSPMQLPLPEMARIDLTGFDVEMWESESAIRLRAADGTEKLFEFD